MPRLEATALDLPELFDSFSVEQYAILKADILALMFTQMISRFENETDFQGNPWEELGDTQTLRRIKKIPKKRRKEGFKILQDNGTLRNSWTVSGSRGNETSVLGDEVTLGSNIEYVAVHNNGWTIDHPGTKNGFGKGIFIPAHKITMPERQMDGFSEKDDLEILELIDSHLQSGGFKNG